MKNSLTSRKRIMLLALAFLLVISPCATGVIISKWTRDGSYYFTLKQNCDKYGNNCSGSVDDAVTKEEYNSYRIGQKYP